MKLKFQLGRFSEKSFGLYWLVFPPYFDIVVSQIWKVFPVWVWFLVRHFAHFAQLLHQKRQQRGGTVGTEITGML